MSTEEQDAIQTTQIDGDVSVGRNVALGGGFISQGKGRVKGDLVVDGWLDAKNIKGVFKGIYLTVEKLKADFPEPEDGWWAIVGKTIPGPIYAADNGKWIATGEIGGQPTISGDEYYESLFEVLQYLTEEFDAFTATKGMPNGLAPLDSESKIPATYLPSYVDDVIEFAKTVESVTVQPSSIDKSSTNSGCSVIYDKAKNVFVLSVTDSTGTKYYKDWNDSDAFGDESDIGIVPQSGKVYVDNNENKTYRWSGTKLVVIGSDLSLGYTEATAFPGSDGKELQQTVALQEQAITSLTSTINSWDNKILNKLDKSVWDSIFILHREDEEDPTKITSIEVKANLWTNGEISAGGQREGGGGSAGGLIQTVYRYTQLNITLSDNDKTNTFNAYTIQQLANRIESLESTPSGISSLTINLGTVSYEGVGTTDVVVNLPVYPTSMAWGSITDKPTTISGYGITDAYTKQTVDDKIAALQSVINAINSWFTLSDGTLITTYNIAADGEVSAGGQSSGGGGGTGGLIQTVYGYSALGGTFSDNNKNDTFNAYTINTLASRIGVLENTPSGIASLTVNLGTVSYVGAGTTDVTVNLPAYPTSLPASDVYAWAKQPTKPAYTAAEVGALTQATADGRYALTTGTNASGTWPISITGNAATATKLALQDTRSVDTAPFANGGGVIYHLKYNTADGLNDGGTYHSVLQFNQWYESSGGLCKQLALTDGGNMWFRNASSATAWGAWKKLLDSSNYASTLDTRYVKKAGDTMTGILTAPGYYGNYLRDESASEFYIGSADHGISGYTGLLLATYGNLPTIISSNGTIRLLVNANGAYWNNQYPLLHSGNIGSFALTPSNYTSTLDSRYARLNTSVDFTEIDTGSLHVYNSMSTADYRLSLNWSGGVARIYAITNDGISGQNLILGSTSAGRGLYYDASKGYWGIGTTAPAMKLHVAGESRFDGWIYSYNQTGWYNGTYGGGIYMTDSTYVKVYNGKAFYVANNIVATGEVSAGNASDRRLKSDISTLSERETAHVLSHLNPVSFTWNVRAEELSGGDKKGIARSFVADEFLSLLPNAGRKMWDDYDAIYTEQAVPYLVKGWQMHEMMLGEHERYLVELNKMFLAGNNTLSEHERRIAALERENAELKRELSRRAA